MCTKCCWKHIEAWAFYILGGETRFSTFYHLSSPRYYNKPQQWNNFRSEFPIQRYLSFYLLTEWQSANQKKDRDSIFPNKDKPNLKKKNPPPIPVERMPQPLNWRKLSKSCLRRSSTIETTFNLENWQFASRNFLQSFRNPIFFAKKTLEVAAIEHVRECKGFLGELHLWPFEPSQSHQRAFNVLLQALGRDRA